MLPEDPEERTKELYAHFGLAYYLVSVLETGLALAIMQADFLTKKRPEILAAGVAGFDRAAYEADFDRYMDQVHKLTAGAMLRRLSSVVALGPPLLEKIGKAIERRNFLAHHFFRERAEKFYTRREQEEMLTELLGDQELFRSVDHAVEVAMRPIRESVGMPEELVQRNLAEYLREMRARE